MNAEADARVLTFTVSRDESGRHHFDCDVVSRTRHARLRVGGVSTSYDVLVDGQVVARGESMFQRHDVGLDVGPGTHHVQIVVRPLDEVLDEVPRKPRARWRTAFVDDARLRWVRTSLMGHTPSLAGTREVIGPWRPVLWEDVTGPYVASLEVVNGLDGPDGFVAVHADVREAATGIDVVLDGPDGSYRTRLGADGTAALQVPRVTRWWPHTHGAPALHDLRLLLDGRPLDLPGDGTGTDPQTWRIGFRELADGDPDGLAVRVNDEPIFVRGAVWTPGDLAALDTAAALGLNLVRVPGWATYESDAFHERCDRLGLMVWQDLMFANFDYPLAHLDDLLVEEVDSECRRLAHHPSTVVVCGSSEVEQQAAMFAIAGHQDAGELGRRTGEIVSATGLDACWVPSAPTGGDLAFRIRDGVASYYGVGAYRRPVADVRSARVRFAAECLAFANIPDDPPEEGSTEWIAGLPRDAGADWTFDDVRDHYLAQRYGDPPHQQRLELGQRVSGEVMAEVFGWWRRPDSGCHGGIVLWLRDLAPGPGWGLLDHLGRPKPAARLLAPVLGPRALWLCDEGLDGVDVHLANDRPEPLHGRLHVALRRADATTVAASSTDIEVAGRGHLRVGVESVLGRFADASYAYRFGDRTHDVVEAWLVEDPTHDKETRLCARWVVDPASTPTLSALGWAPKPD